MHNCSKGSQMDGTPYGPRTDGILCSNQRQALWAITTELSPTISQQHIIYSLQQCHKLYLRRPLKIAIIPTSPTAKLSSRRAAML